jgi:ABC-type glucose/galactose transport system permease subunit
LQSRTKGANISGKRTNKRRRDGNKSLGQQGIVFAVFAVLFAVFALILPGFLTTANMLTLLQNVAVLGILGLAMAIVVIGRGNDILPASGAREKGSLYRGSSLASRYCPS